MLLITIIILIIFVIYLLKNNISIISLLKSNKEHFLITVKDKQKIGTSEFEDGKQPKSSWKAGGRNYETCYSTETRNGNTTGRINGYYCNQGIDGGEVIPAEGLYSLDFSNYTTHPGKKMRGKPLTGFHRTFNGSNYSLNNDGSINGPTLTLAQSKSFCDFLKDKCEGFYMVIPTKDTNQPSKTFFIEKKEEGWEDPDTYSKITKIDNYNTNIISYVKKDVNAIEKPINQDKINLVSDKYKNLPTCNWKSSNRCIFKDYKYDQSNAICKTSEGLSYSVNGLKDYSELTLSNWLKTLYNRDLGANKLASEAVNVNEYVQRCKDVDGYEFLSGADAPNPYIPTTKQGDVKGRFVRITINNSDINQNWLQLAEVQVISNNRNIAISKSTSSSGNYPGSSNAKANDGNNDGNYNSGSVYHSGNGSWNTDGNPQFWEVDLGDASKTIDRIIISNRTDGSSFRLSNWLLSIYDYNKNLVWARIYRDPPNPIVMIDIKASENDINNIRIKDYIQSRFNKYFYRLSDTEFKSKGAGDCGEQCLIDTCKGEGKKWIGNYQCRDYRTGEREAEEAEKNFSHTFTNAGATGSKGPTLAQVRNAYSNASWAQDSNNLNMTTQGIQLWKVPVTGTYSIIARGAKGYTYDNNTGKGRIVQLTTKLIKGEVIKILVGQKGLRSNTAGGGGGGGGTFVIRNIQDPILIAGGGGSGGNSGAQQNSNASDSSNGAPGVVGITDGGSGGSGGRSNTHGGGGGGLRGDGSSPEANFEGVPYAQGGSAFVNGGKGGYIVTAPKAGGLAGGGIGGFGGGGSNWGGGGGAGGGGYSGGGGGSCGSVGCSGGGGGGSYGIPTFTDNGATNTDHGSVTITLVSAGNRNPGITIYSEPEYKGKSLFLKHGNYDKNFFISNWKNLGIGSYKNNDNSPYMIRSYFTGLAAGGGRIDTYISTANNWSKVINNISPSTIIGGIIYFKILTADEWKKYYCWYSGNKRFDSHWPDIYPSSDC